MVALTFDFDLSSKRALLQASSLQFGKTSEVNRMFLPSGDHNSLSASVEMFVILRASPAKVPAAGSKSAAHICEPPSREETNSNLLPSGDHRGRSSLAGVESSRRASPPCR